MLDPTGLVVNVFYWLVVVTWGGLYLVTWTTDVPTEKWGRLRGLRDDVVKLLLEQEQAGRARPADDVMARGDGDRAEARTGFFGSREEFYFRSCGLFRLDNPFRRSIVVFVHHGWFDNFILLLIATNAMLMATEDPLMDPDNPTPRAVLIGQIDLVFLLVFTAEMGLKCIAFGFVVGPNTYLRSAWNVLDGVIVCTAWLPYFLPLNASSSGMRAFRLLRPLRTISRFPGLKRLVTAILLALPQLANLLFLCGLFFGTLGIVGVQLWHGRWLQRCHNVVRHPGCDVSEAEGENCQLFTQYANDASPHCNIDLPATWSDTCGAPGAVCEEHAENPFSDTISFDSIGDSFPIVLQLLTLAAWQDLMHISWETTGLYTTVYYVAAVLLGAYFVMNLFVAVIKDKFDVASAVGDEGILAFKGIDDSGDGILDMQEIGTIFLKNGVYLSDEELEFVFSKIDADGGGDVDVDEFMGWLRGPSALAAKLRNKMSVDGRDNASDDDDTLDTDDPIASAKKKLTKLASVHGVVDWTVLFNYYDREMSGELEFLEFKAALRRDAYITPQMMPDSKVKELFDAVDEDGGGSVSIAEFERWITGKTDSPEDQDEDETAARQAELQRTKDSTAAYVTRVVSEVMNIDGHSRIEAAIQRYADVFEEFALGDKERRLVVYNQPKVTQHENGEMITEGKSYLTIMDQRMQQKRIVIRDESGTLELDERVVVYQGRGEAVEVNGKQGHVMEVNGDQLFTVALDNGITKRLKRVYLRRIIHEDCLVGNAVEFTATNAIEGDYVSRGVEYQELVKMGACRKWVRRTVLTHSAFNMFFAVWILLNVLALAMDEHNITADRIHSLEIANHVCTFVFVGELVVKQMGKTAREFWMDVWTLFDVLVVVAGVLEFAGWAGSNVRALKIFRVFRLFRVLRVLRIVSWLEPLRTVLTVMIRTLNDLVYILLLLSLFVFIFTILGMQMFGGIYAEEDYVPRWNFDSFNVALFTTFQVMTYDSWNSVMTDTVRVGNSWSMAFFVVWILAGALVLMNLLLVIILESYVKEEGEMVAAAATAAAQEAALAAREARKTTTESEMRNPLNEDDDEADEPDVQRSTEPFESESDEAPDDVTEKTNNSWASFPIDDPIRQFCIRLVLSNSFDNFIMFIIVCNCITMGMDTPDLAEDSQTKLDLNVLDLIFTLTFTVEAVLKSIAFGFVVGEDTYLKMSFWNKLDFSIVVISWVDYIAQAADIGYLKSLRLLRAFRALRMLNRVKSLQQLAASLAQSMISLSNVIGVTFLMWLVFALMAMMFLKGRFWSCTDHAVFGVEDCVGTWIDGGEIRESKWKNPPVHFDDTITSMYALYEISSQNDWIVKAHYAMDATEVNRMPVRDTNSLWGYFFIVFVVINNFFLLNLFVGVIYEKYLAIRMAGMEKLTKDQTQWLGIMRHLQYVRPEKKRVPTNADRESAFKIAINPNFEWFIMGTICVNCAVMATKTHDESKDMEYFQEGVNILCTIIFTGEAGIKIFAFGPKEYFQDSWNQFDFFVVAGSWADIVLRALETTTSINYAIFRIVRIARIIGRVGRIFKGSQQLKGLQIIFDTFINALPSLVSITALVLLILYVFAILGMNLFGKVAHHGPCLGKHRNFESAPIAMMTLFGVATADGFACMTHACMVSEDLYSPAVCTEEAGNCGSKGAAQAFFMAFSLIIMFSTIQLTVNIVMSKFDDLTQLAGLPITKDDCDNFVACWQVFDKDAEGKINTREQLPKLLKLLETGIPKEDVPHVRALAWEELAGEEEIDPRELRLPELPTGTFSRFLLDSTEAPTFETPLADIWSQIAEDHTVDFLSVLYGLCERKVGKPMPAENGVVAEARLQIGLEMPLVEKLFQDYKEKIDNEVRDRFLKLRGSVASDDRPPLSNKDRLLKLIGRGPEEPEPEPEPEPAPGPPELRTNIFGRVVEPEVPKYAAAMQALFANPQDEVVQKATQAACVEHKKREIFAALEYAFKRAAESERAIAAYAVHALYDVEVLDHDDIEIYYTSLRGDAELKAKIKPFVDFLREESEEESNADEDSKKVKHNRAKTRTQSEDEEESADI